MWPPSRWAVPVSSFTTPVLPPTADPDAGELVCVSFAREWQPYILGALTQLLLQTTWRSTDPDEIALAQARARNLINMIAAASNTCDDQCVSFPPSASFIEWFPNDPYRTPDFVGEGYLFPAWYLADTPSNILFGTSDGDAITSIERFPPGSLPDILPASGLPRFRVNVSGPGLVELHLVNMYAGSTIQITVDDDPNPLAARFVDVLRDAISIPPETQDLLVIEIPITGAGAHHIDCIVVSQINDAVPFLFHGGGLRKVVLCGFESVVNMANPVFKFTDECGLEISYNGVDYAPVAGWNTFAADCFTGPQGVPGEQGEPGEQGIQGIPGTPGEPGEPGECLDCGDTPTAESCRAGTAFAYALYYDHINPALNNIYLSTTTEGSVNQDVLDDALAAWNGAVTDLNLFNDWVSDLFNWEQGLMGNQLFGLIDTIENIVSVTAKCFLYCGMGGGNLTAIVRQALISEMYELAAGDPHSAYKYYADALSFVSTAEMNEMIAAYYATTTDADCEGCNCEGFSDWCYTFDFTVTNGGFTASPNSNFGVWTSGAGWGRSNVNGYRHVCYIIRSFTDTTLTSVEFETDGIPGLYLQIDLYRNGVAVGQEVEAPAVSTDLAWSGFEIVDQIQLAIQESSTVGPVLPDRIISCTVRGKGTNPFGEDNC